MMDTSSSQTLDLLKYWIKEELSQFVELQNILPLKLSWTKGMGRLLIGGHWEFLFMKCTLELTHLVMTTPWEYIRIFWKEKFLSHQYLINKLEMPSHWLGIYLWLIYLKDMGTSKMVLNIMNLGVNDIKKHRWFAGFSWEDLLKIKLKPAYIPTVKSLGDVSNFD